MNPITMLFMFATIMFTLICVGIMGEQSNHSMEMTTCLKKATNPSQCAFLKEK